ncbi:MAG: SAM-dependent methyltransferase, partial [Chloroflexota bacterium]|nr:SAM-dependent methyltransferase [Chloroflexota bacterium]
MTGRERQPEREEDTGRGGSNGALVAAVRDEILANGGRITFARYMDRALYHPVQGYYLSPEARPGRGGDFLTAPELSPFFGRCLARQLRQVWDLLDRPAPFTVLEYGAGGGGLARDILSGARDEAPAFAAALRYVLQEINPYRREAARGLLDAAGFADRIALEDPATPSAPPPPFVGAVIANEFVDALAVHRVVGRDNALLERYVRWDRGRDWFAEELDAPSTPRLAAELAAGGVALADGQSAEINLAAGEWLAAAG